MVIKGGLINWANMGDPNASLPTPQPVIMRPMFGSFGKAMPDTCYSFVSQMAFEDDIKATYNLERNLYPLHKCRQLSKYDMIRNTGMPNIEVDPETLEVFVDGVHAYNPQAKEFALAQLYWFS